MKQFERKSRLRSTISWLLSAAMLASIVVMPAFGATQTDASVTSYNAGSTQLATILRSENPGLNGVVDATIDATSATVAVQESNALYQGTAPTSTLGADLHLTSTTGDHQLHIMMVAPVAGSALGEGAGYVFDVPITLNLSMTVAQAVAAMDAAAYQLTPTQQTAYNALSPTVKARVDCALSFSAIIAPTGRIRLTKGFAEASAEIWAEDNRDVPDSDGAADLIFGIAASMDANVREFGRGDGFFYNVGVGAMLGSIVATFTPTGPNAKPYQLGKATSPSDMGDWFSEPTPYGGVAFGYWDGTTFTPDDDFGDYDGVDPCTGQWNALRIGGWPEETDSPFDGADDWDILLLTNAGQTVMKGTAQMALGNGVIKDATCEDVTVTAANGVVAGTVETFTINIPDQPTDEYPWYDFPNDGYQNGINGVRVLFGNDESPFTPPNFTAAATFATASVSPLPAAPLDASQDVSSVMTTYGPMVEVTDFFNSADSDDGNPVVTAALMLPTDAAKDARIKVWIRKVGSDRWMPLWCCDNGDFIDVVAGPVKTLEVEASDNRAGGFSWVTAVAKDQYGNEVNVDDDDLSATTSPGVGVDGTELFKIEDDEWAWRLPATEGTSTVTVKYQASTITDSDSVSTVGVGDPVKVVIIPTGPSDYYEDDMYLELRDANNHPTSFLDQPTEILGEHKYHMFKVKSVEFDADVEREDVKIHQGWALSTRWNMEGVGQPEDFDFGYQKPGDVLTITATSVEGLVEPSPFKIANVPGKDACFAAGEPYTVMVTANKQAPAAYAWRDEIYNEKDDLEEGMIADTAFGYAEGNGVDKVTLTAQVVDINGNPVTSNVASIPVTFEIPSDKWDPLNGTLVKPGTTGSLGHLYKTATNGQGIATVDVMAYRPTKERQEVEGFDFDECIPECEKRETNGSVQNGGHEYDSWFTPIMVSAPGLDTTDNDFEGIGEACETDVDVCGWGFAYFYGGRMKAELQDLTCDSKTITSKKKDIVLADGIDTTSYIATVKDVAFDTPVANWDVRFTTSFGSFDASGTMSKDTKTDANGVASVNVMSTTAGDADLVAVDRQRTVESEEVYFTDYAAKSEVLEPTKRAGDRAEANVRVWWENIKSGARVMWSMDKSYFKFGWDKFGVYGTGTSTDASGTPVVDKTNFAADDGNYTEVDTNADGKFDAIEFGIPAKDVDPSSYDDVDRFRMESAGERFALIMGHVSGKSWVGKIFYDKFDIKAAATCPTVNFVKESTLKAEGTQFSSGLSMIGEMFTPGDGAPDFMDRVKVYLGDITQEEAFSGDMTTRLNDLGTAFVGRDGVLLPVVVGNDCIKQLSPGFYDITVDGLVFKNGLEIKNMFGMASLLVGDAKKDTAGTYYLDPYQSIAHPLTHYKLNVNAFGNAGMEVWSKYGPDGSMTGPKLQNSGESGLFIIRAERLVAGYNWIVAKIAWPENEGQGPYTTVAMTKVFRMSKPSFSYPTMTASGRLLTVRAVIKAPAESNGAKNFLVRIGVQRFVNGKWSTYAYKMVRANPTTGKVAAQIRVKGAGKYRAFVYHSDLSHVAAMRTGTTLNVK